MESGWIKDIFDWVQLHPNWTGILIFLFAFGESILLVGIILPGAAFLLALGTMIGLGAVEFYPAWFWASLGAFFGDGISFWIGHKYKRRLLKIWPMYKFPDLIDKGERFFKKYGGVSVFIGRFVGPVRPVIPAIGGMMGMNVRLYVAISLVASILWAPFYLLPGMLFGSAMDQMAAIAGKLAVLVLALVALIWVVYWLISMVYMLLVPRAYRLLSQLLAWTQRHPKLGKLTSGLVDPRESEKGSLAMLAFLLLLFLGLAIWLMADHQGVVAWNQSSDVFFYHFHNPWTELPMKWLMYLGHDLTLIVTTLLVAAWLLFRRLTIVLWHWLFLSLSSYIFAVLVVRFAAGQWLWFGSAHVFWFAALATFWAVVVSGAYPIKWRSWPYVLAGVLVSLHSFAALFFFKLSLGVVLISIFTGGVWAMLVGLAFRTRNRKQFLGWPVKAIFIISVLLVSLLSWLLFPQNIETNKPDWLAQKVGENSAVQQTDSGYSLNIEVEADADVLLSQLEAQGWSSEAVRTWGNLYQALLVDESDEDKPVMSSLYMGEVEQLMMSKRQGDNLLVLRLWQHSSNDAFWQGYLSSDKEQTTLYWFHYWGIEGMADNHAVLTKNLAGSRFVIENEPNQQLRIIQKRK
ncbi:DedA family protein [Marinicella rhabdoformis]|uniref:DedA family protein n=1 Tax=Marinicella rhabdoformis TaxID=2580566 RepID=UPI0012AED600|nr:DedA family protein [Marinicella rhabdoformis]